jgi:hypothetical protein
VRRYLGISRPCYNKFHRCPGGSGGGIHSARVEQCDGGYLGAHYDAPHWKWRVTRCPKCDVLVLPYMIRYLDPAYLLKWELTRVPGRIGDSRRRRRRRSRKEGIR